MKRSREFSSPLNGMNLSWAQKELFISCWRHSVCLYRAQPCSEAQQTTFLLKAQIIGRLQSPGPQSRVRGSSLGVDIKGAHTGGSDGRWAAAGCRGGLRGLACPRLEGLGKQPGSGAALRTPTSKAKVIALLAGNYLKWQADGGGQKTRTGTEGAPKFLSC